MGLGLWALGVGLAFRAQHVFAGHVDEGRVLFLVASALAVAAMLLIDSASPKPAPAEPPPLLRHQWRTRRMLVPGLLLGLGLLASWLTFEHATSSRIAWPASLWAASLVLVTLGVALGSHAHGRLHRPRMPRLTRAQMLELGLVLGILALALALRVPKLASIPPDVFGDEANIGLDARALLHGGWNQLFQLGWFAIPQLSYAISAVVMRVFGDSLYGLRMSSLLEGVLSVALLYLVVRRLFGARPALLAAFVLAVAQWHIHFSRTGYHYMQALLATLLVFFFALRALDERRELDFLLTGFALGLCLVVYYAARIVPVVLALYIVYRILSERGFLRTNLLGLAIVLLGMWVFLAPQVAVFRQSPEAWSTRVRQVSLFSADVLAHERQVYGVSSTAHIAAIQAQRTIESFNRVGDTSSQYGRPGKPLFDFWSAALLVPGAVYAMSRLRQSRYLLLTLWLWVPLVFGVMLTNDAPFTPRMIVVLPVLAIFPALVVEKGWRGVEQLTGRAGRVAYGALVALLAALMLYANYHHYFQEQVKKINVAGFFPLLARYALEVNGRDRIYFVSGSGRSLGYETVRFLDPHLDGADVGPHPRLPLRSVPPGKGAAFVLDLSSPGIAQELRALERVYPGGVRDLHRDANGVPEFWTYEVSTSDLDG